MHVGFKGILVDVSLAWSAFESFSGDTSAKQSLPESKVGGLVVYSEMILNHFVAYCVFFVSGAPQPVSFK